MLAAVLALFLQTQFGATVEVRVVNIDVVVTDKTGHRVAGLTKDDFEILEDGKRQTISNFYEVAPATTPEAAAATPPRPRRFIIFVDNDSLAAHVRRQFFAALRGFVDAQLHTGDQASLISWSSAGLHIAAPLTSSKAQLQAAIDRVEAAPSPASPHTSYDRVRSQCVRNIEMVRGRRMPVQSAYADCLAGVRAETMVIVNSSRNLMNAVNVAMSLAAGAEGKKVLVLAGATLPQKPGFELFRWANVMFQPYMAGFDTARDQVDRDDEMRQKDMLDKLARSANAHGVSLYTINAPVTTDNLDMQNITPGQDLGGDYMRIENTDAAFSALSELTGGVAIKRPADFNAALGSIAGDLESYYSLGYRPHDDIGRDRAVVVHVKNPEYVVRARQTYAPKTADEQIRDRVVANIYSASTKSDWSVSISSSAPQRSGDNFTVPIEVSVPSTLTLLPQEGGKLTGGFAVYIAVGNRQGALSTISRSLQPVAVPAAEEAAFRKLPITFGLNLTLKPGENMISIAVTDQVSHATGFARTTIVTQ